MDTKGYLDMDLLRFSTAGSVDDGKSTLIGRLLYDSKSIFEDQMEAVEQASRRTGSEDVNLALLTDGLRSEREQGITIDVAYRYFATPVRKFIIADTPGHIQYTRNMVTGASTTDLAIILIDARNGVSEQTLRHTYIASLLGIEQVVVCINKMDIVDFSQKVFDKIKNDFTSITKDLNLKNVKFIPVSAKYGDNVVDKSENMPWYDGCTLLHHLETVVIDRSSTSGMRFPVQYVVRPISDEFHDFRGYAGRVSGAEVSKGDKIIALPSGIKSQVTSIHLGEEEKETAQISESVAIQLADDIDIGRGDILVAENAPQPNISNDIRLTVCWLNQKPMSQSTKYIIRHTSRECQGVVKGINHLMDINTLKKIEGADTLKMNDIGSINLRTSVPLVFDLYAENRNTGSLIFIDPDTFETVGAGIIE
ncbi:MAG: GTP-binding protein [Bacteroidales bacterium]|nr:GTP-binding protein [Bacteroidales bacterium]